MNAKSPVKQPTGKFNKLNQSITVGKQNRPQTTITIAWPSGMPHNDCLLSSLLLMGSSTSKLSPLYNSQGDVYRAVQYFINWLAVSEAAPRLDPFGNVLHQRKRLGIYIHIFLFFKISLFSRSFSTFLLLFYFYLLPRCCVFVVIFDEIFFVLRVVFVFKCSPDMSPVPF